MRFRLVLFATFVFVSASVTYPASANAKFVCHANPGDECAFSVQLNNGYTNFVVEGGGGTHELPDSYKGFKYCVNAGPKRQPPCRWPECWAQAGKRIVRDVND